MPLIPAAAAPTFELPGITFTGLASPSRGSTQTCVWTLALDPGMTGAPHHLDQEEVFVAVEGEAVATVDGEELPLRPGDGLVVPARTSFSISNPNASRFVAVAVLPVGGQASWGDGQYFTPPWAA
jgi:mannose-6-phosphate isomerase-like protein (cupin superfamily)